MASRASASRRGGADPGRAEEESQAFGYDSSYIDWWDYWINIHIPALRDRRDDIPLLLNYFLRRYNQRHGRAVAGFTTRAVRTLLNYSFPGNIRELQNLIERGVIAADDGASIDIGHLFISGESDDQPLFSISDAGTLADEVEAMAEEETPDLFRALARVMGQKADEQLSIDDLERIADYAAYLLNGDVIEEGEAEQVFENPREQSTADFVAGIFG